jgi:phosphoglycerate dehydrogenase-like enzyme
VTATAAGEPPLVLVATGGELPPGLPPDPSPARFAFAADAAAVRDLIPRADALFVWDFRSAVLRETWSSADRLRWVHVAGAGVDATLFPELVASDVVVTNARGVFDRAMAEYAVALMLAWVKDLPRTIALQKQREWLHRTTDTLEGKRLVVIGPGSIGRAVARLASAFDMQVDAVGRSGRDADPPFGRVFAAADLAQAVARSDFVVVTVPLTPESRGLVGHDALAAMAPGTRLINLARGDVVDEDALVEALVGGRLAGAALDVFHREPLDGESPLWAMDNVVVSPHMSGDLHAYEQVLVDVFLDNLDRWVRGRPLRNVVDKRLGFVASTADGDV